MMSKVCLFIFNEITVFVTITVHDIMKCIDKEPTPKSKMVESTWAVQDSWLLHAYLIILFYTINLDIQIHAHSPNSIVKKRSKTKIYTFS